MGAWVFSVLAAVAVSCLSAEGARTSLDMLLPRPQCIERGMGFVDADVLSRVRVERAEVSGTPEGVADEAYQISIGEKGVVLFSSHERGERYARTTLRQIAKLSDGRVPVCTIRDWPSLRWRGYMNDCGRNYLSMEGVKAILDMMAAYKMNLFHWHLSDYHGWRLESKRYPQLNRPGTMLRQKGRYYTQDEFREIVRYAAQRGITVMPELDVPGHTLAFRKGMGIGSMSAPGIERVVSELFEELCSLASADVMPFVHIGTDEVRTKAERCNADWPTAWARTVNAAGRRAVVWAPGEPIDGACDVIDMVWHDNHVTNTVNHSFDAARMYNTAWTPFEVLYNAEFKRPCRWSVDAGRKLGAITCTWHDDNVGDDTLKLFRECMVFPSIVAMSDNFWRGRANDRPEYVFVSPKPGSGDFARAEELERRMVAHRDRLLSDFVHPFPFVAQTGMRWRVTDLETGAVVARDLAQGTLRLKEKWSRKGIAENVSGTVAVETWIFAPTAMVCGAWIDLASINGVYGRLDMPHTPLHGQWDAFGGRVELNGCELPPPEWRQPGLKSTTPGECEQDIPWSTDLLEIPLVDEMATLRDPYPLRLRKGWNHVRITTGLSGRDRAVTFMPISGRSEHPREVAGLRFRADPPSRMD